MSDNFQKFNDNKINLNNENCDYNYCNKPL